MRSGSGPDAAAVGGRWGALDVLRGVALTGILFVNTLDITRLGYEVPRSDVVLPDPVRDLLYMTVQTRFVPIFAFLFGMSLWFVLDGARARARRPWLVVVRRMAALFAIGSALAVVYPGNILPEYAVIGLVVLPLVLFAPRPVVLLLGAAVVVAAYLLLQGGGAEVSDTGLILAGSAAAALGLPRVLERAGRGVAVVCAVAAALTVPALLLQSTTPGDARFTAWGADAGLVMAVLYVTAVALLGRTPARPAIAAVFEPLGRMALTNYASGALVVAGAALVVDFQHMTSVLPAVVLGVVVIAVQSLLSRLWLRRFRYGPLEWVWRVVTWWSPVPIRASSRAEPLATRV